MRPGYYHIYLASRVPEGQVTGIDSYEDLILQGQQKASNLKQENVLLIVCFFFFSFVSSRFRFIFTLENDSFDVVVAH